MLNDEINKALEILKDGGVILYPTDTIWGLGCDATNEQAVEKIFALKGRDSGKSMLILLDSDYKLPSYVSDVPEIAYDLIEFAENPLTIIYSKAKNLAKNAIAADGSIGIRIVRHEFCKKLIERLRKPIISTSANFSGHPSPSSFADIPEKLIESVDYVVNLDQEKVNQGKASTIMKLDSGGQFTFIRR